MTTPGSNLAAKLKLGPGNGRKVIAEDFNPGSTGVGCSAQLPCCYRLFLGTMSQQNMLVPMSRLSTYSPNVISDSDEESFCSL